MSRPLGQGSEPNDPNKNKLEKMGKSEDGELSSSPIQGGQQPTSRPFSPFTTIRSSDENTRFPRYSTAPTGPFSISQQVSYPFANASAVHLRNGPEPQKGTPQDRFKQAVLGICSASQPLSFTPHAPSTLVSAPTASSAFAANITPWSNSAPGILGASEGESNTEFGRDAERPSSDVYTKSMPRFPSASPYPLPTHRAQDPGTVGGGWAFKPKMAPTALLSMECQKRKFNPEFIEATTPHGAYICSVKIQGQTISSTRSFPTAPEAKYAIAEQALKKVRKWPVSNGITTSGVLKTAKQHEVEQQTRETRTMRDKVHGSHAFNDDSSLKQTDVSTGSASRTVNMDNPIEKRAFLEGIKIGQQLAASEAKAGGYGNDRSGRGRSRSPGQSPNQDDGSNLPTYRRRSPSRHDRRTRDKHHGHRSSSGSSHGFYRAKGRDPTLPNTDRYRPYPRAGDDKSQSNSSSVEPERDRNRAKK